MLMGPAQSRTQNRPPTANHRPPTDLDSTISRSLRATTSYVMSLGSIVNSLSFVLAAWPAAAARSAAPSSPLAPPSSLLSAASSSSVSQRRVAKSPFIAANA
ncbi:hypothetical protein TSOC_002631 [Tetrabaena socialis]|uniref:Uncharacterized protein n=1 Tax=Tetrabaena socialis TaxID=47790 RepID=A0A2J8ADK4_9CHLO|nr:hypothetical protein TSOC_002631 [Tetrabaena socialis]|eukprot:PNH10597.1 hypothetical protein TSOC_002631 [Tetrabaena socialis]